MQNFAIFWDYQNAGFKLEKDDIALINSITKYAKSKGKISLRRIYGKWDYITNKDILLYCQDFDKINVPFVKPNSVDVKLAVDVLNYCMLIEDIDHVILVTGDQDFIPVVLWLKNHGIKVTLFSRKNCLSSHLLKLVDDFVPIEKTTRKSTRKKTTSSISYESAFKCLIETVKKKKQFSKGFYEDMFVILNLS